MTRARSARVRAQAKINLFLLVGNRETDGYHDLLTLFLRLDLADEIIVRIDSRRSLVSTGPALPPEGLGPPETNLAYRAAAAYADRAGWPEGFEITLEKNVPVGGGLGGGSADAAAVLRALDTLNEHPLGEPALMQVGRGLGADVPFLVSDRVASLARGRGDLLDRKQRVELEPRPILLLVPPFSISTADAYRWLDADRRVAPARTLMAESDGKAAWTWDALEELARAGVRNDFEPVVERRQPTLRGYREWLEGLGGRLVRMSGSGSTVFGVFDRERTVSNGPEGARLVWTRSAARVVQVEVRE